MERAHAPTTIELGALLHDFRLSLVLIAGVTELTPLRPVQWVHSSELEDPTPFLTPRTVLLTTAARFDEASDQAEADAYVERLIDAGVSALGIAIGLHWDRVPLVFVRACDRLGLPLFRVPYATSFISIVQTAARLLDLETHARDTWLLESQRLVTNASLQRNGLGATIRETASRLGRWVAIADRTGRITEFAPRTAQASVNPEQVRRETRRIIERGVRASRIERATATGAPADTGSGLQLRALGRHSQVLGVLIVEDAGPPDQAERTLIGLVEALATVQLEHRTGLGEAEGMLRAAIVDLLIAGEIDLAERVAGRILTRIPRDPIVVFHHLEADGTAFADDLQSLDAARPGVLRAQTDSASIVVAEARHAAGVRRLLAQHGVPAGESERGTIAALADLMEQATLALAHATDGPVVFRAETHSGVFDLLRTHPDAAWRAEALIAPLTAHDALHTDALEESLRVWLRHHGQTSPAAAELGIHRHTLRARVQTAARLLNADLESPDARAELWTALRLRQ